MSLIERIEGAQGPSRELDAEIAVAVGWRTFDLAGFGTRWQLGNGTVLESHPTYTGSMDAAMTLLPPQPETPTGHADFILECTNGGLTIAAMVGHDDRDKCSWGATPALALCAAALRASDGEARE